MALELDHLFIASQINAPEIEELINLGFIEGSKNIHPGQGTANRRIFLQNFMLELLFIVDETEVSSPIIAPTQLKERCNYRDTGFSPFGIAFHRQESDEALPFLTWAYQPPYLPLNLQIDIAQDTNPEEPFLFIVPFKKNNHDQPSNHPINIKEVTGIEITLPSSKPVSQAVQTIEQQNLVRFIPGSDHLAILECDRLMQQKERDFRPHLPLIIRW